MIAAAMLCGCDQASSDRATVKTARSLTAERGLVAKLDAERKLKHAYSDGMQRDGVKQLVSARAALSTPDGQAGQAIGAAATLPDNAGALRAAARRLAKIETQREDH